MLGGQVARGETIRSVRYRSIIVMAGGGDTIIAEWIPLFIIAFVATLPFRLAIFTQGGETLDHQRISGRVYMNV